jgi:hypothetical protein
VKKCSTTFELGKCKSRLHWDFISPQNDYNEGKQMLVEMQVGRDSCTLLEGSKLGEPQWESIWQFLRILKIHSWVHQKECKSAYNRDICTPTNIVLFMIVTL